LGVGGAASENCSVYMGRKFFVRYLLAVLFKLSVLGCREVKVEAIGRNIHRAVMVAESVKEITGRLRIKSVVIGSVTMVSRSARSVRKSKISIVLERV